MEFSFVLFLYIGLSRWPLASLPVCDWLNGDSAVYKQANPSEPSSLVTDKDKRKWCSNALSPPPHPSPLHFKIAMTNWPRSQYYFWTHSPAAYFKTGIYLQVCKIRGNLLSGNILSSIALERAEEEARWCGLTHARILGEVILCVQDGFRKMFGSALLPHTDSRNFGLFVPTVQVWQKV